MTSIFEPNTELLSTRSATVEVRAILEADLLLHVVADGVARVERICRADRGRAADQAHVRRAETLTRGSERLSAARDDLRSNRRHRRPGRTETVVDAAAVVERVERRARRALRREAERVARQRRRVGRREQRGETVRPVETRGQVDDGTRSSADRRRSHRRSRGSNAFHCRTGSTDPG